MQWCKPSLQKDKLSRGYCLGKSHKHIASGDDAFLLRNMQQANKSIELGALNHCQVTTPNPNSIRAFIQQRSRWFGKTFMLKDQTPERIRIDSITLCPKLFHITADVVCY